MIEQGLELVLFGMGTVFVFLTMLVFVTGLLSTLVLKFSAPIPQSSKAVAGTGSDPADGGSCSGGETLSRRPQAPLRTRWLQGCQSLNRIKIWSDQ